MKTMLIQSNRTYDTLKFIAQIVLPALGALYFGLSGIWGLPYSEEIVGTITVIDVFLGSLLGLSASAYKAQGHHYVGAINVTETPERKTFQLEFENDPGDLDGKDEVTFKINRG